MTTNAPPDAGCTIINQPTWDERAAIHARDITGFYGIERFCAGEDVMLPIESAEIGDVAGRRVIHLQCHLGVDALCLARRGADVTGLDFSSTAIASARTLAERSGVRASFIQSNVYDAAAMLPLQAFDVVYVSWGSLNWLSDLRRWADVVANLLAPGGYLYLVEQHPFAATMREDNGYLWPGFAWRTPSDRPIVTDMPTTYNDDPTPLINTQLHEWEHPLSDIIGGLLASGLQLDFFREHEVLPWRRFSFLVPYADRLYRLPLGRTAMPLAFSLKASKPRERSGSNQLARASFFLG